MPPRCNDDDDDDDDDSHDYRRHQICNGKRTLPVREAHNRSWRWLQTSIHCMCEQVYRTLRSALTVCETWSYLMYSNSYWYVQSVNPSLISSPTLKYNVFNPRIIAQISMLTRISFTTGCGNFLSAWDHHMILPIPWHSAEVRVCSPSENLLKAHLRFFKQGYMAAPTYQVIGTKNPTMNLWTGEIISVPGNTFDLSSSTARPYFINTYQL